MLGVKREDYGKRRRAWLWVDAEHMDYAPARRWAGEAGRGEDQRLWSNGGPARSLSVCRRWLA